MRVTRLNSSAQMEKIRLAKKMVRQNLLLIFYFILFYFFSYLLFLR